MKQNDPYILIDNYLERVRLYLPDYQHDETLREIRSHLTESAEKIAQGRVTVPSVLQAIEMLGEPSHLATEYTPHPRTTIVSPEYYQPWLRLSIVFAGFLIAILGASLIVRNPLAWLPETVIQVLPIIVFSLLQAMLIAGAIIYIATRIEEKKTVRLPTERTTIENLFGFGVDALKPKTELENLLDLVFGVFAATLLMIPYTRGFFIVQYQELLPVFALIFLGEALMGFMRYRWGENYPSFGIRIVIALGWLILTPILLQLGFPFSLTGIPPEPAEILAGMLGPIFVFAVWIIAAVNIWEIIKASVHCWNHTLAKRVNRA